MSAPSEESAFRSDIAWSDATRVVIHGHDLVDDLLGSMNLGDFGFLALCRRVPTTEESQVFNAMLVSLAEHGLTANVIASRMTYLGAPESLQGAVAAGLLGLGSRFVGTIEDTARLLQEAAADDLWRREDATLQRRAGDLVDTCLVAGRAVPGIGHPIHQPVDPRAEKLFELARLNGVDDAYERLLREMSCVAGERTGRALPVNVTGAIGAISTAMDLPWQVSRGLGVMARAVGIVGHILEEMRQPLAGAIQRDAERRATRHIFDVEP